jgi:hypothetical protein
MAPSTTVFFILALTQPFRNRIQHVNPFCCKVVVALYSAQKIIQNGVNIQDGDFTFSHQSV